MNNIFIISFIIINSLNNVCSFIYNINKKPIKFTKLTKIDNTYDNKYNLNWYVIGEKDYFQNNKLYKITIWNNDYLVYKNNTNYYAMDNYCSHRGASLVHGKIVNGNIMCPYHGYEFNHKGILCNVPGLNFINSPIQNQNTYHILEKNGWVYLNTINNLFYQPSEINIFEEPEEYNTSFSNIFINTTFNTYARIVSENSLDVMHIGFVHTFGNRQNPSPLSEKPPYAVNDYGYHYKTEYEYEAGDNSLAKKIFGINKLFIENEFILPHTTIARVIFGNLTSTIITNALPINNTHSHLFVKTYRNFWNTNNTLFESIINYFGNIASSDMMMKTVMEDKAIIENIKLEHMEGKFNMKYDKLQNVYKTLYKKLIKNITFPKDE
jgi:phenylpropionate dioxygenase-like ring-hydroxylating dioxygenase large terminal subunit